MKKIISIRSSKNFKRTYTRGTSFFSNLAILYLYFNNLDENRVGYSVSKKIGKAVTRNRVKRLFREVYRKNFMNLKEGYDMIFVARKSVLNNSMKDIENSFAELFRKSGLLKC